MPPALFPELNNLGVDALECGDYPRAVEFFRYALQSVQADIRAGWLLQQQQQQQQQQKFYAQQQQRWSSHPNGFVSSPPASPPSSINAYLPQVLSQLPFVYQMNKAASALTTAGIQRRDQSMMIYTQGIRLLDRPGQIYFSQDQLEETKICSSIVIFNLGLTFHLQSLDKLQDGCNMASTDCEIRKAKSLYQQVHRLIVGDLDSDGRPWSTGNALLDLVRMAVLNNMAQISLDCMDFLESDHFSACFIRMSRAVTSASYSTDEITNENIHALLRQETNMLLSNAATTSLLPHNAAPAA